MSTKQIDSLHLRLPSPRWRTQVLAYRDRFARDHDSLDGGSYLDAIPDFDEWLDLVADSMLSSTVHEGQVPATAFLVTRRSDERLVGMVSVRHELNDFLRDVGGHIGYSIHPDYRRRGYATTALGLALIYCREALHLDRVLVTCNASNIASRHTILKHHGNLSDTRLHAGNTVERYWIDLPTYR